MNGREEITAPKAHEKVMFDRSLLEKALFEFVVVSDTHYTNIPPDEQVEFESRRRQSARSEVARAFIDGLEVPLVMHLGDLVQEYPGSPRFEVSRAHAMHLWSNLSSEVRWVAGNHDVGDKPDPTLVGLPIQRDWLDEYHKLFGPSWYSFDRGPCHFVVINGQLVNAPLPEAKAQMAWLEFDLQRNKGRRTFLFVHMPLYLYADDEPGLGHYDNIAQPGRGQLLDMIDTFGVEWVFSGHVHFSFFDRRRETRYLTVLSPAFTRPGFPHLFTASAPAERGRDDAAKLGFYLMRVTEAGLERHLIRTSGATALPLLDWGKERGDEKPTAGIDEPARIVLTRSAMSLRNSSVGVTLTHPLASFTQVPLAWPSAVRQPVRNDYPLLACVEAGVRYVRTPAEDLDDAFLCSRIQVLRGEGTAVIASVIWESLGAFLDTVRRHSSKVDGWELRLPGGLPTPECLAAIEAYRKETKLPISLSPVITGVVMEGKQHPRTRLAYTYDELLALDERLRAANIRIDRAVCMFDANDKALFTTPPTGQAIAAIDFVLTFSGKADGDNADALALALLMVAGNNGSRSRLFVEPLIDLDRTMDTANGLLDAYGNPRKPFNVLRTLNSILYGSPHLTLPFEKFDDTGASAHVSRARCSSGSKTTYVVLVRSSAFADPSMLSVVAEAALPDSLGEGDVTVYNLSLGTSQPMRTAEARRALSRSPRPGPLLLVVPPKGVRLPSPD